PRRHCRFDAVLRDLRRSALARTFDFRYDMRSNRIEQYWIIAPETIAAPWRSGHRRHWVWTGISDFHPPVHRLYRRLDTSIRLRHGAFGVRRNVKPPPFLCGLTDGVRLLSC